MEVGRLGGRSWLGRGEKLGVKELINNWPSSHRKVFCRNMQGQMSNMGNSGRRTRLDLGFAQQRGARG